MKISDFSTSPTGTRLLAFAGALLFVTLATGSWVSRTGGTQTSDYSDPVEVGRIQSPEINESSGLSASECQDVLWTHNDAGNEPVIFAMASNGGHLGAWRVENSKNIDWESIATYRDPGGKCHLLIGDFGDNDENRRDLVIYRVPEPEVSTETASATAKTPLRTQPAEVMRFAYPDGPKNAETILVQPKTGDVYVLTKNKRGPSEVHKLKQEFGSDAVVTTQRVAQLSVPSRPEGLLTGGSISPDGTRVMVCDVKNGYEYVLPSGAADFDLVWKQKPMVVNLGSRKQGEGVSYGRDGLTLYASSEKKSTPIMLIKRK
jgi:hypothetical protein